MPHSTATQYGKLMTRRRASARRRSPIRSPRTRARMGARNDHTTQAHAATNGG